MAKKAKSVIQEARRSLVKMIEYTRYLDGLVQQHPPEGLDSDLFSDRDAACVRRALAAVVECERWEQEDGRE